MVEAVASLGDAGGRAGPAPGTVDPFVLAFPGLAATSPEFRGGMVAIARDLGTDPNWLLAVQRRESGFNPAARNALTDASGLIQFMPRTARNFGTTVEDLRAMTREQQLHYVWRFYRPHRGRLVRPVDAYLATFAPAFIGRTAETALFTMGPNGCSPTSRDAYCLNRFLDVAPFDGVIRVGDLEELMTKELASAAARGSLPFADVPLSDVQRVPVLGGTIADPKLLSLAEFAPIFMVALPAGAMMYLAGRKARWSQGTAVGKSVV